jgi:hypothetical protein
VNRKTRKRLQKIKRRIERRLEGTRGDLGRPMFRTEGIRVELADKVRLSAFMDRTGAPVACHVGGRCHRPAHVEEPSDLCESITC